MLLFKIILPNNFSGLMWQHFIKHLLLFHWPRAHADVGNKIFPVHRLVIFFNVTVLTKNAK